MSDNTLMQVCEAKGIQISHSNCSDVPTLKAFQSVYTLGTLFENNRCSEDSLLFLCTAINSLCIDNSSLPPLYEECIQVRDNKCSSEWRTAKNLFRISVPSCDSFKDDNNLTFSSAPIQTCPDAFGVFCDSLCLPLCQEITLFNDEIDLLYRIWFTTLYAINLIGGVITMIAIISYRQKMYV